MDNINLKTGGFETSAEFYRHARKFFSGEVQDNRIEALRKAAMTEGTDSAGGVLVPTEWAGEVYAAAMETAIVRPRAIVIPMGSDSIAIPVLVDGTRATNIFGGVTLTGVGEGADQYATTVNPALGRLTLTAKKFIASCFVSNELAADAVAFGPFMNQAFGQAVRFLEDDLFFYGTGSGQPLGIMNSNALIGVTRAEIGANIADVDIAGMAARFAPGCWQNAAWLINQSVLGSLTDVEIADLGSMQILGRPIIVSEHCAAAGTIGDILLCDFSQYLIGDRALIISSSREATYSSNTYGFLQDQTIWKLTLRIDGQPIVSAPYTPKRGGSTVSPFVALTTAS